MTFSNSIDTPHHFFARMAGNWRGIAKLWIEPDKLASDESHCWNHSTYARRTLCAFLYQSSIEGEPQHGMFTFGYNTTLEQYETSWVDSFHTNTGIMFCIGAEKENGFPSRQLPRPQRRTGLGLAHRSGIGRRMNSSSLPTTS
jgi:hypothetical protein